MRQSCNPPAASRGRLAVRGWFAAALLLGLIAFVLPLRAEALAKPAEALVIIVNKNNPVENVTMEELRKLCLGERTRWENQKRVTIALREPGQFEREAILKQVYAMNEQEFRRHFLQFTYTGGGSSTPKQLATDIGVRRFVFNVPGAIGFVRASEVDDSVKVVTLDGKSAADAKYALKVNAK